MESSKCAFMNLGLTVFALGALFYVISQHRKSAAPGVEGMDVPPPTVPIDPAVRSYEAVPPTQAIAEPRANDCFHKDRLTAEDLLPKDQANEQWAQVNPAGQGDVSDSNFLNAGYHMGSNTIAGTLRNANLQIRSEPPNPRSRVSVWNESTIEPDLNRRPFEIDGSC